MPIVIITIRDLAQTPSRLWIVVSGTLTAATGSRLLHELGVRASRGHHELYLDLRELRCAHEMTTEAVRGVFALDAPVRLHLISAPDHIRAGLQDVPDVIWHVGVESAWQEWV